MDNLTIDELTSLEEKAEQKAKKASTEKPTADELTTKALAKPITKVASVKCKINKDKPIIALTFDDGPNTTTTVEVLDKLKKYNVVASFFVVGANFNDSTGKVVCRAYDMGCEINNHSLTHSNMSEMSAEEMLAEVIQTSNKVYEITGEQTRFFRPPYIAVSTLMLDTIDMPFICGYGTNDWDDNGTAKERAERILDQVKDGAIILLHDLQGNYKTVEALDIIIPELQSMGYQFVTVSELFVAKNITLSSNSNIIYSYAEQTTMYKEEM